MEVTAAMVHAAANEVQLGERQVKARIRWPWLVAAAAVLAIATLTVVFFSDYRFATDNRDEAMKNTSAAAFIPEQPQQAVVIEPATTEPVAIDPPPDIEMMLDSAWLNEHQREVWQGLAQVWHDDGSGMAIQAACDGDNRLAMPAFVTRAAGRK